MTLLLLRTSQDCKWLDENLQCTTYDQLGWNQTSDWFRGQTVRGDCECKYRHDYQEHQLHCQPKNRNTGGNPGEAAPPLISSDVRLFLFLDEGGMSWQTILLITLIVIFIIICIVCTIVCGC